MDALTRDEVRELDRIAIEEYGIPGCVLMENAGGGAARAALSFARAELGLEPGAVRAAILCGAGNNGGDGYVMARHLANEGVRVELHSIVPPDRLTGDAAWAAAVAARMGLAPMPFDERTAAALRGRALLVDALLGTGARGDPRPPAAAAIEALNRARAGDPGARVVALDLPSGLDADSGAVGRPCVRADLTLAFAALKTGLVAPGASPHVGRLELVPIGAPIGIVARLLAARRR